MRPTTLQPRRTAQIKSHFRSRLAVELRDAIEGQELSHDEVAIKCFVTPSTLSRALSGRHNMTIDTLALIMHGLGTEVRVK